MTARRNYPGLYEGVAVDVSRRQHGDPSREVAGCVVPQLLLECLVIRVVNEVVPGSYPSRCARARGCNFLQQDAKTSVRLGVAPGDAVQCSFKRINERCDAFRWCNVACRVPAAGGRAGGALYGVSPFARSPTDAQTSKWSCCAKP